MSTINTQFLQQIASIVQPISIKSDEPHYTVDGMYREVVSMIGKATMDLKAGDFSAWKDLKKAEIISEKSSVLDTLKDLQAMACKRREISFKYPNPDKTKDSIEKKLTSNDLDIIEEFIKRLPEAYEYEEEQKNQSEETETAD